MCPEAHVEMSHSREAARQAPNSYRETQSPPKVAACAQTVPNIQNSPHRTAWNRIVESAKSL